MADRERERQHLARLKATPTTDRPSRRRGPWGVHRIRFEKRKKKNPTKKTSFSRTKTVKKENVHYLSSRVNLIAV
jgi:hypothetical protein